MDEERYSEEQSEMQPEQPQQAWTPQDTEPAQQPAEDTPYFDSTDGQAQYWRPAQQSSWQPQAAPQPTPKPKKEPKKVSRVWIPILLAVAILVGAGGGAFGYWIASKNNLRAAQLPTEGRPEIPTPTTPDETRAPISDKIRTNEADGSLTPAQIYSENVNAVVGIASESTGRNVWGQAVMQASSGSGFVITSDGYVVTNYHVVEGASNITVQMYDGTEYPATVVGYEKTTCDVALLKIDATDLKTVAVGDSDTIRVGDEVCAIGNPLGELTFTQTVGHISALDREVNIDGTPINMFQTDAAINSGNSGGPLFDAGGNVIGITTAKYSGSTSSGTTVEGIGFVIPINDVMEIVDDLTQYGYVTGKPYLGVMVGDSAHYGDNLPAGAFVTEVTEGNAAQKAGLQKGDVIVGLGESVVGSQADLTAALAEHTAGETVLMTVYREGKYLTVEVTLDERPREQEIAQPEPTAETEDYENYGFGDFGFGWPFP